MEDWVTAGLVARGMDPRLALAFGWNGMDESGLNPGINEIAPLVPGSRGGFGAMQWTGPRRRALEAFAADRGASAADRDVQLDFLMSELNGPEAAAWAKISAAQDTPSAAAAIVNYFLRPAEEHRARRERKYLGGNAGYDVPAGYAPQGNALAVAPQGYAGNALAQPQQPQWQWQSNALDPRAFLTAATNFG